MLTYCLSHSFVQPEKAHLLVCCGLTYAYVCILPIHINRAITVSYSSRQSCHLNPSSFVFLHILHTWYRTRHNCLILWHVLSSSCIIVAWYIATVETHVSHNCYMKHTTWEELFLGPDMYMYIHVCTYQIENMYLVTYLSSKPERTCSNKRRCNSYICCCCWQYMTKKPNNTSNKDSNNACTY